MKDDLRQEKIKELTSNRAWGKVEDDPMQWRGDEDQEQEEEESDEEETELADDDEPEEDVDDSKGVEEDSEEDEEVLALKEQLAEARRQADGRLKEIIASRNSTKEIKQELASLRVAVETPKKEEEDEALDPYDRLENKIDALGDGMQETFKSIEEQAQFKEMVSRAEEVVDWGIDQEAAFTEDHSNYGDAYDIVQNAVVESLLNDGVDPADIPEQLQVKAIQFTNYERSEGRDPAATIYQWAQEIDSTFKAIDSVQNEAKAIPKKKRSAGLSNASGVTTTPSSRQGVVTHEQIFTQLSKSDRMDLFRKHPEVMKAFDDSGSAKIPQEYLERMELA